LASRIQSWKIFSPENDPRGVGFRGVVLGKSNNKLLPNQVSDAYNYVSNGGPEKRKGNTVQNAEELVSNTGITGLFQFYFSAAYHTFAKCGTRVFDVSALGNSPYLLTTVTEAGDDSNQLSNWSLTGGGNHNTDSGVLYWSLTDSDGDRTVELYKNSDGAAGNLVASGTRTGDGSITLNEANSSGLTGSVTVAYIGDDTDLENNTLTYPVLGATTEIEFVSWLGKYFFVDGINLYYGTGVNAVALTLNDENGSAISGVKPAGKSILVKGERLWLTRDPNYPTRVYYSLQDYYDRFGTNGGSDVLSWVACGRDDGQAIVGFAIHNNKIFVAKQQKHYWITGDPSDTWPYSGTLSVSDPIPNGAYDQKTITDCPDGFLRWWGPDGVFQYSDSTGLQHISDNIDYELNQIATADRSKACAGFVDNYYLLMLPDGISDYCDGFAFDTRIGEWFPIKNWNISRMAKFEDDMLYAGFYDVGHVAKLFSGTVDNVGQEDISCYLKSKVAVPPGYDFKKFEHCLDKLQMMNIKNGQSFNLFWNCTEGKASGSWSFTFDASGVFLGEVVLGDSGIPDDGDLLISVDELTGISANPSKRMNSAQRFVNLYFEVSESGPTAHSFDFLQIDSYALGEVR
jgi:hypothetical protein